MRRSPGQEAGKTASKGKQLGFPAKKIRAQLEKIFADPHFTSSETLRTFLSYIVEEKINGRENCLKEYTVAVNVLGKSADFKPQENGIVRIHAVRLRKAMASYYSRSGQKDEIRISLPKGSYIPEFTHNVDMVLNKVLSIGSDPENQDARSGAFTAAVIPFYYPDKNEMVRSFADGLGIQLSASLMELKDLNVVSYNMIRRLRGEYSGMKELAEFYNVRYIFTGDVQFREDKVRVTFQMTRADNHEMAWCRMIEKQLTAGNCFMVQDEIISEVMFHLRTCMGSPDEKPPMLKVVSFT
jgi:TolB-like protein